MDKKKINIDDLYYGIVCHPLSWSNRAERDELRTYNLFNISRIKYSVARYVTMKKEERDSLLSDPVMFCFGDVWGRTEYEFMVSPWVYGENDLVRDVARKVDVYQMYVLPNKDYLMSLVNRVSKTSAQKYIREWKKRVRG